MSDLATEIVSDVLLGRKIDFVVCGSIAAVESVRAIRALRRLGAEVSPWLSEGAAQFVGRAALEWASGGRSVSEGSFDARRSHVAVQDACVIAPASANVIGQVVRGVTSTPALALVAAYLGSGKPVMVLPCMHDSMWFSPFITQNREALARVCHLLPPLAAEGRRKFDADPEVFADRVAHLLCARGRSALVTLGGTRSYLDPVRYLGNYSSGGFGTLLVEELYRRGFVVDVVAGAAECLPRTARSLTRVEGNAELEAASLDVVARDPEVDVVMAAALLDFECLEPQTIKVKTSQVASWDVRLIAAAKVLPKILERLRPGACRVACKLESDLEPGALAALASPYLKRYRLDGLVVNRARDVSRHKHRAFLCHGGEGRGPWVATECVGKRQLAQAVAELICRHPGAAGNQQG